MEALERRIKNKLRLPADQTRMSELVSDYKDFKLATLKHSWVAEEDPNKKLSHDFVLSGLYTRLQYKAFLEKP